MILFLSTLALAGDPIPAANIRPLTLNADGELVEGPALADLVAAPGVYDLGELYADWLLGEDDDDDKWKITITYLDPNDGEADLL